MFFRHHFAPSQGFIGLVLLASVAAAAHAQDRADWPQFLGPQRSGISSEVGLIDKLPDGGPKVLWRAKGGVGMSGVAIAGGRALTLVQRDSQQWLIALDAATGKPLWQTPLASQYTNQMGDGPRATPTIADERVFAFTGEGILSAVSLADGKPLWSHNVVAELKGKPADYGMASSPLVVGDIVVVMAGAPRATLAAYDAKSGALAWTAGDDPAGYSSPALRTLAGQSQIVAFTGASAVGVDPEKGSMLWRYAYETDFHCNIAVPLEVGGNLFLSAGENHGCVLLSLAKENGRLAPQVVWQSQGSQSVLRNEWQTSILLDEHLYGFDNVGSAGPVTHLACVHAATGKRVWQKPRFGKGNLIAADGKLWISTMNGELVLLRATPKAYEELGRAQIVESTRQAPSLSAGRLYLRDDTEIVCLDLRK
jgi:outer membrane protein assembly factor BamB